MKNIYRAVALVLLFVLVFELMPQKASAVVIRSSGMFQLPDSDIYTSSWIYQEMVHFRRSFNQTYFNGMQPAGTSTPNLSSLSEFIYFRIANLDDLIFSLYPTQSTFTSEASSTIVNVCPSGSEFPLRESSRRHPPVQQNPEFCLPDLTKVASENIETAKITLKVRDSQMRLIDKDFYFARQIYFKKNHLTFGKIKRTEEVHYKNDNLVDFHVKPDISQEPYNLAFERYGIVAKILNGDQRDRIRQEYQIKYDQAQQTNDIEANYPAPRFDDLYSFIYKDGKTYVIEWIHRYSDFSGETVITADFHPWLWAKNPFDTTTITSSINQSTTTLKAISDFKRLKQSPDYRAAADMATSSVSFIARALNNDIVYITQPECYYDKDEDIFTTTVTVDCYTRGLSADGRAGQARYHDEESGFGGWLGGILVGVISVFLPMVGFWLLPTMQIFASFSLTMLSSLLSDPVVQGAFLSGALGTVATSNNLGVGPWEWRGGFQTLSLVALDFRGPSQINLPEQITLYWATKNADSCLASGDWSGVKQAGPLPYKSESFRKPRGNYSFNLTCSGANSVASSTINTRVVQLPLCNFSANPSSISSGQTSTLSWDCDFADSCSIDQNIGAVNSISGTKQVQPNQTTAYTLICSNSDGQSSKQATINVGGFKFRLKEIIPR